MTWAKVQILFLVLLFGLVSCSAPPKATTPPSPQPIRVSISPFLEPVREAIHLCTVSQPDIALIVDVVPQDFQEFNTSDIVFWWGDKPDEVDSAFQIAEESLVVIVHPDNTNTTLSASELQALFNGRIEHWTDFSILDEEVTVWLYPEGSYTSEMFKFVVLEDQEFSRLANLAPSPTPMLAEISTDPGAIGFVPRAWLSAEVSQVNIDPATQAALNRPILALTNSEPHSGVREMLACLQSGTGQEILAAKYPP
jgi:hypothetical protein